MSSEPSIITREQIDTLRGLLNDVGASDDVGHAAVVAIGGLLDRVEARDWSDMAATYKRLAQARNVLADEVDRLTEENARLRLGLRPESGAAAWAQHVGATLSEGVDGAETATTAPRAANRAPVGESDNAQADDAGEQA